MKKIFIYCLKCPETYEIRYIGKTKSSLKKRLYEHCTVRNLKPHTHKNFWIKNLLNKNKKPIIELIEECNELNWKEREIFWISQFNNLTNTTLGGEGALGFSHKKETIEKILKTKKKNNTLKRSVECRKKISNTHKERNSDLSPQIITKKIESMVSVLRKPIKQYDLFDNLINEWDGLRKCSKELNISHSGISRCLNNKQKSYKGFIWRYE